MAGLNKTPDEMAKAGWQFGAFNRDDGTCISVLREDGHEYGLAEFSAEYSTDCRIVDLRKCEGYQPTMEATARVAKAGVAA
ncbi:hypothetical protein JI58_07210 [Marinosulfonomonas sp. PRT-SC04]|nr:hypothetical protein JI58_07210 [Marinosulfonomonas sp. PRT-SC04]